MSFVESMFKIKWHIARRGAFSVFEELTASERMSYEQKTLNLDKLRRRAVTLAMKNCEFYKTRYRSIGFDLGEMEQEDWFEKLPIVTKEDLREHFEEFINHQFRRHLNIATTGGSTGVPTKAGYDRRIPEEVYSWRLQRWFGVNPWDDHAYVWRDTRLSRLAKLKNALLWWPTKHLKMDATFITEKGMADFVRKFNKLKPVMLQGYVGAVTQLAQFVVENKISVHSPKFVWTTSAPLPDSQRKLIERAFNAPVCDQYGSCEVRWIAQQCPECGGLHVNTEHVHIEFVDENNMPVKKGTYGKTLLTNLEDTVFPLIRYENGDRGRWLTDECPCGRTLPLIDSVKGRESESFVLPSGKTINGEFLTTIFDPNPDLVSGFRVVQHKDSSVTVEFVPSGDEDKIIDLIQSFAAKIGDEVRVDYKSVESIPHDRGKLRFIVKER